MNSYTTACCRELTCATSRRRMNERNEAALATSPVRTAAPRNLFQQLPSASLFDLVLNSVHELQAAREM